MAGRDSRKADAASELRTRTPDELAGMLLDLKREQFNLRFQAATGQQEGTARVRDVRRTIARIKTLQHETVRGSASASTKQAS